MPFIAEETVLTEDQSNVLGFKMFGSKWRLVTRMLVLGLAPVIEPIEKSVGQDQPLVLIPLGWSVIVVMLAWPQVVFALIGGFLSRRFKITITRR